MATGIADLGNNVGYIYKVGVDKTTIVTPYLNTPENARNIKVEGLKATSSALNRKPYGTITVDTVTGVGTITSLLVGAWDIIGGTIPYTGATTTSALAVLIKEAINSFNNGTIHNYTATVAANVVTIIGEEALGASDNGAVVSVNNTGLSTYTAPVISGGSDATEVYDLGIGWTFFIDSDYGATGCSGSGTASPDSLVNAVEITNDIVPRSLNSALDVQQATISSGSATVTRKSAISLLLVDTEASAAADDLNTLSAEGYANGDTVRLLGQNASRVVTVKSGTGNITLTGGVDFLTEGKDRVLTLYLAGTTWYEAARTTQSIGAMADYRTAGFGFFGVDTYNATATAAAGTVTFNGGTDSKYQKLTGAETLTANSTYALGTGVAGDEFWLEYDSAVTAGAFALSIFGITLTTAQAIQGSLIFHAKYMSGAWYSTVSPNLNPGATNPFTLAAANILASSITVAKVETTLKTDLVPMQISWDTNRIGDHKIVLPFPCTVTKIDTYADDLIEATDDADIDFKNNAGLSMGTQTLTAGTTIGSGVSSTPTVNNTFTAGQVFTATTTKANAGGNAKVSITIVKS